VHSLRETQHTGLAHKIRSKSSSISLLPLHTLHTCTSSKSGSSSVRPTTPG